MTILWSCGQRGKGWALLHPQPSKSQLQLFQANCTRLRLKVMALLPVWADWAAEHWVRGLLVLGEVRVVLAARAKQWHLLQVIHQQAISVT